jgi:hypothetical protein
MFRFGATALAAALILPAVAAGAQTLDRPVRTFPQFAGSWVLDEAASWSFTFALVADALALTRKDEAANRGGFTTVTDAYSVDGDVLTVRRQLTSVTAAGTILVMQEPRNNASHMYRYRRRP